MRDQFTALSVPVEAAYFLQPFRERHITTPAAKKPPHVTLARTKNMDDVEKEFYLEHGSQLPIKAMAREVCLYEKRDGIWHKRYTFALAESS